MNRLTSAPAPLVLWCRSTYGERAARMLPCYMRGELDKYASPGKGNRAARRALEQCTLEPGKIVPPASWSRKTCYTIADNLVRIFNCKTQKPWLP